MEDNDKALLAIIIAKAILTYGPTAVLTIAKAFDRGEPSVEEIEALFITKSPEEYFK